MTRKTSPLNEFDPLKMWSGFDPLKTAEQFTKMFGDMGMDMGSHQTGIDAVMASQRKSLEALTSANQKMLDGVRAVSERQAEIVRDAVEKTSSAMDVLGKSKTPQEAAEKHAVLVQNAYDKSVRDLTELSDLVVKASKDAAEPITTRIQESFEEIKVISGANGK